MRSPPRDVSPERLYRLLTAGPVPSVPVTLTLAPGHELRLAVRGLSSHQLDEAIDALPARQREELRSTVLVSLALVERGSLRPVFGGWEELLDLPDDAIGALAAEVAVALGVVSPLFGRSDAVAWSRVLKQGARAPGNLATTYSLGSAVDEGATLIVPRPDRFFGVPLCALTDGQRMAFTAARELVTERMPKPKTPPRPAARRRR